MLPRLARHSALVPAVCQEAMTLMAAVNEGTWQLYREVWTQLI